MASALITSAFGEDATLYGVLDCDASSTPQDLKRAYRKAALRHHPDRCRGDGGGEGGEASTLKFQAVSAAYQILMDERKRAHYDRTGRVLDDGCSDDSDGADGSNDDDGGTAPPYNRERRRNRNQTQWEQFFQSVFDEMISTGSKLASSAAAYRGSAAERDDVLRYYEMCKGDLDKVVECVVHGCAGDVGRWSRDIVQPAIVRGEVLDFSSARGRRDGCGDNKGGGGSGTSASPGIEKRKRRTILEDSSEDDSDEEVARPSRAGSKKRALGKGNKPSNRNALLIDTDDEDDGDDTSQPRRKVKTSSSTSALSAGGSGGGMSKRDKMEYRVAKKRKARAEKEMEMANIIQSKDWGDVCSSAAGQRRRQKKNMGGISDAFLSSMEERYGGGGSKKGRKKR